MKEKREISNASSAFTIFGVYVLIGTVVISFLPNTIAPTIVGLFITTGFFLLAKRSQKHYDETVICSNCKGEGRIKKVE